MVGTQPWTFKLLPLPQPPPPDSFVNHSSQVMRGWLVFSILPYHIFGDSVRRLRLRFCALSSPPPRQSCRISILLLWWVVNRLLPPLPKDPLEALALGSHCLPEPASTHSVPGAVRTYHAPRGRNMEWWEDFSRALGHGHISLPEPHLTSKMWERERGPKGSTWETQALKA